MRCKKSFQILYRAIIVAVLLFFYAIPSQAQDGTQKWVFPTGGDVSSSPAIDSDGTIYVGSDDGKLYAINPTNGTEKWYFTTGGEIFSSPVIDTDD
jgi:outer membrane protein assembly factor BamB